MKTRQKVYDKYTGHCAYCGKEITLNTMQVDHIIPKASFHVHARELDYSVNDLENLNPTCRRCNHYKRAESLENFRRKVETIPDKLTTKSYIYRVGLDYKLILQQQNKVIFYFEREGK